MLSQLWFPFLLKVHFAAKAACKWSTYCSYRQKDTKHVEVHESNDNLQKKSTQDKSLFKISSLSASGTAESSRSPTKAST